MEFDSVVRGRRSIRRFKVDVPVEREKVLKIIESATFAPSACNKVLTQYIVVDDDAVKSRLIRHIGDRFVINTAPVWIIVTYDTRFNRKHFANIQSAAAAVQNLILSAYNEGIGTLWMCSIGNKDEIKRILEIPDYMDILCIVAVGYSDIEPITPKKPHVSEITHFNKFEEKIYFPDSFSIKEWSAEMLGEYLSYTIYATSPLRNVYPPPLREEFEKEVRIISEHLSDRKKVLFMFPHVGRHMIPIIENTNMDDVWIYDFSKHIINFCLRRMRDSGLKHSVRYIVGDGTSPNCDEKFDAIVCTQFIERHPDKMAVLKTASDMLGDNGIFILSFRNLISYGGLYTLIKKRGEVDNFGPISLPSFAGVEANVRRSGMEVVRSYGVGIAPLGKLKLYVARSFIRKLCRIGIFICKKR